MRGPQLGVQVDDLDFGRLDSLGLPYGIEVTHVTVGSPAEADGLRAGDVIVKMDRRTIRNIDDVQRVLDYFEPSERLKLEIIRDKNRKQLEIVLGEPKGPRNFGQWRQWMEPYYQNPPFFADPEWWREMLNFIKQWKDDRDKAPDRSL